MRARQRKGKGRGKGKIPVFNSEDTLRIMIPIIPIIPYIIRKLFI